MRRQLKLLNLFGKNGDDRAVGFLSGFQFFDAGGQVFVGRQDIAEPDERADADRRDGFP